MQDWSFARWDCFHTAGMLHIFLVTVFNSTDACDFKEFSSEHFSDLLMFSAPSGQIYIISDYWQGWSKTSVYTEEGSIVFLPPHAAIQKSYNHNCNYYCFVPASSISKLEANREQIKDHMQFDIIRVKVSLVNICASASWPYTFTWIFSVSVALVLVTPVPLDCSWKRTSMWLVFTCKLSACVQVDKKVLLTLTVIFFEPLMSTNKKLQTWIQIGGTAVQSVALLPHRSRVPGSYLSLGYCQWNFACTSSGFPPMVSSVSFHWPKWGVTLGVNVCVFVCIDSHLIRVDMVDMVIIDLNCTPDTVQSFGTHKHDISMQNALCIELHLPFPIHSRIHIFFHSCSSITWHGCDGFDMPYAINCSIFT